MAEQKTETVGAGLPSEQAANTVIRPAAGESEAEPEPAPAPKRKGKKSEDNDE